MTIIIFKCCKSQVLMLQNSISSYYYSYWMLHETLCHVAAEIFYHKIEWCRHFYIYFCNVASNNFECFNSLFLLLRQSVQWEIFSLRPKISAILSLRRRDQYSWKITYNPYKVCTLGGESRKTTTRIKLSHI